MSQTPKDQRLQKKLQRRVSILREALNRAGAYVGEDCSYETRWWLLNEELEIIDDQIFLMQNDLKEFGVMGDG